MGGQFDQICPSSVLVLLSLFHSKLSNVETPSVKCYRGCNIVRIQYVSQNIFIYFLNKCFYAGILNLFKFEKHFFF